MMACTLKKPHIWARRTSYDIWSTTIQMVGFSPRRPFSMEWRQTLDELSDDNKASRC